MSPVDRAGSVTGMNFAVGSYEKFQPGVPPGMPKTLGIWEWGCPKRGDAQNAVTPPHPFFKGKALGTRLKALGTRSGDAKWSVKAGCMSVSENVDKKVKK